jgi:hypothetical protein
LFKRAAGYLFLCARRCPNTAVTVITFAAYYCLQLVMPVLLRGATIFMYSYFYNKTGAFTLLLGGLG